MYSKLEGKKKGKGKEMGFGKDMMTGDKKHAMTHNISSLYEGALDSQYFVIAAMRDGNRTKGSIIECRESKQYSKMDTKNEYSYDYYIHFEGFNRRNDMWVERTLIETTTELIQKKKKKGDEHQQDKEENEEHEGMDEASLQAHLQLTKVKTIERVQIGKFSCETWYYSPYPKGYHNIDVLHVCDFCLNFYVSASELGRHMANVCRLRHPPGDEIYRDETKQNSISMFEVDAKRNPVYAENLGYLSKLFLDHKNLQFSLDPFLIYVLTENDEDGSHIVGYFSKWKECPNGYNLSCILVLPCYQRKGYGKFLISFSYELSLIEGKPGTPERPLSDLGRASYLSWWSQRIVEFIRSKPADFSFSIHDICKETGMTEKDVNWSLKQKNMIKHYSGQKLICTDMKFLDRIYKECGQPGVPVYPQLMRWKPYRTKYENEVPSTYQTYSVDRVLALPFVKRPPPAQSYQQLNSNQSGSSGTQASQSSQQAQQAQPSQRNSSSNNNTSATSAALTNAASS